MRLLQSCQGQVLEGAALVRKMRVSRCAVHLWGFDESREASCSEFEYASPCHLCRSKQDAKTSSNLRLPPPFWDFSVGDAIAALPANV